jgi:hypothetical protein
VTVGEEEGAREVLVTTFDHYTLRIDLADPTQRTFQSKAIRWLVLTVKFRQLSHVFTFGVGMSFISHPLVLTPLV